MVNTHQRSVYKRFSFDFYKPDGSSGWEKINIKDDKKGPKKGTIGWATLVVGDSVQIEYQIKENGTEYNFNHKLDSGEALFIDQTVREFQISCTKVMPKTAPKTLVSRQGTLVVQFERD